MGMEEISRMYAKWGIDAGLVQIAAEIEAALCESEAWQRIKQRREYNQLKVLAAFHKAKITEAGFGGSSGYGYDDLGRERLEEAFSYVMGAEKSLVRIQISSGTQAIALGLYGILRPGELLLSATGLPYDTLYKTIGIGEAHTEDAGSLRDFGVSFSHVDLTEEGKADIPALRLALQAKPKMLYIQRSRGYSQRPALLQNDIREICHASRSISPETVIFVDNCYGEFTDRDEPLAWGADLMAGSLIKNPGGGLAASGGYICGKAELVDKAASRLSVPGLGAEVGPSLGQNRLLTQGLYLAPHVVAECLMGLSFTAALLTHFAIETNPSAHEERGDIIQTLTFRDAEGLISFCQAVQAAAPVDAFVRPVPGALPGYSHEVIMAAGAFVQGSSIELSADGPLHAPWTAYMQGGLTYEQVKLAALLSLSEMQKGKMHG